MNTSAQVNLSTALKLHNLQVALGEVIKQLEREGKPLAVDAASQALDCLADAETHANLGR